MLRTSCAAAAALALCLPGAVSAGLRETKPGVFVDDFEDGKVSGLAVDDKAASRQPKALEIVRDAGKSVLHLKGQFHTRAFYPDRQLGDFSLEVRMKKTSGSYAGVVVRDHWRVYLQMKCFLSLNCELRQYQRKGELMKSGERFPGYRRLKVVCAGPVLHAYVDGKEIFKYRITPGKGRVGFYAHGGGEAYYDEVRIDTHVGAEHYVLVEPQAKDDSLVFAPDEPVKLAFRVSNYADSPQQVTVSATVKTWAGEVVKKPAPREVRAPAAGAATAASDVGRLPAGLYRVCLHATTAGKDVARLDDLPLAVQRRGSGKLRPPKIPVAAYYKYFNRRSPLYMNTYAHAAARSLKDHHFNAVVADPSFDANTIGIFASYGVATIARGRLLDNPAVIATLVSDEPKPDQIDKLKEQYRKLRETTDKPITTCLVGDGLGLGLEGGPLWIWRQLKGELRCFRWYGIKKSHYGVLHDIKYKGRLPLSSILRIAEAASETPYWFVAPALGKTTHEAYFHKPSPAEIRSMMHLALAYGADGVLFWAFQSHGSWPCLVEQRSLQPNDGTYAAAGEVAALVEKHADLLAALRLGGLDVRCPSPAIDARPLHDSRVADRQKRFVYAVNKDTKGPVSTRLMLWAERWALSGARDVYTGREFKVEKDDEGYLCVPLTLAPGAGMLLEMDVADVQAKK